MLNLYVRSNFGEFQFEQAVSAPQLNTLTVAHYSDGIDSEKFKSYFVVCLFVGEWKKVNWGTKDDPSYDWSYDRAVYTFTPGRHKMEVQAHDGTRHITDCDPRMGM